MAVALDRGVARIGAVKCAEEEEEEGDSLLYFVLY